MKRHEIVGAIRDYHWMINEIIRVQIELKAYEFKGTAQYGIEATMPKAVGQTSNPIAGEIVRREAKTKRMIRMEEKIQYIQKRMHLIEDEMQRTVLDCLLDGVTITGVSKLLRISRPTAHKIFDEIVDVLEKE